MSKKFNGQQLDKKNSIYSLYIENSYFSYIQYKIYFACGLKNLDLKNEI